VDSPVTNPTLLVRLRRSADAQAWSQFVQIYSPLVYRYARRAGLQDSDAADITQDVMHTVMRSIAGFNYDADRGAFRGWLRQVTRTRIQDLFRREHRQPVGSGDTGVHEQLAAAPGSNDDQQFWEQEHRSCLFDWAAGQVQGEFQDGTWQAFWRTSVEGRETKDVAAELGLSVGSVYVARSRVLARLREKVAQIEG
jgi:RNA polymerase sigma-70 factor (ECF subfamily)